MTKGGEVGVPSIVPPRVDGPKAHVFPNWNPFSEPRMYVYPVAGVASTLKQPGPYGGTHPFTA